MIIDYIFVDQIQSIILYRLPAISWNAELADSIDISNRVIYCWILTISHGCVRTNQDEGQYGLGGVR